MIQAITLDAAETIFKVRWHPIRFPVAMAVKYFDPELDQQVASEVYGRMLSNQMQDYWAANRLGEEAGYAFWNEFTCNWLKRTSKAEVTQPKVDELMGNSWTELFSPTSGWFELYDDVIPFLNEAQARELPVSVLSNWDFTLARIIESHNLTQRFHRLFPSLAYGVEKPDVELFRIVEKEVNQTPESLLHIGDHPSDDFHGATNAGWRALLIDRTIPQTESPRIRALTDAFDLL